VPPTQDAALSLLTRGSNTQSSFIGLPYRVHRWVRSAYPVPCILRVAASPGRGRRKEFSGGGDLTNTIARSLVSGEAFAGGLRSHRARRPGAAAPYRAWALRTHRLQAPLCGHLSSPRSTGTGLERELQLHQLLVVVVRHGLRTAMGRARTWLMNGGQLDRSRGLVTAVGQRAGRQRIFSRDWRPATPCLGSRDPSYGVGPHLRTRSCGRRTCGQPGRPRSRGRWLVRGCRDARMTQDHAGPISERGVADVGRG